MYELEGGRTVLRLHTEDLYVVKYSVLTWISYHVC